MNNKINLTNLLEKIIKLRINNIIEKSNLDEKTINEIKSVNENIEKNNKKYNKQKVKHIKKDKKDKILSAYNTYIKDANNVIKNNPTLNFLSTTTITQINKIKEEKDNKIRLTKLSIIWKTLDNNIINKYKELTKDKNFTNEKYNNLIEKPLTPKIVRKKKSKELK